MSDWDPDLYRRFEDERTRPAADLLARVPLEQPGRIVDLGCGPGNSTDLLHRRFPNARILGVDRSEAMLASAKARLPDVAFEPGDAAAWHPDPPPDLIFCNAVLQWVPNHRDLFPRLLSCLAPGGILAVQMPDTIDEPSHRLMREVAGRAPWREFAMEAADRRSDVMLAAEDYYDLLAVSACTVDLWRTTYRHPLGSEMDIVDWFRSTGLRPYLDALPDEARRQAFLADYAGAIAAAYPRRADGLRLLAFPRLFIVARRRS